MSILLHQQPPAVCLVQSATKGAETWNVRKCRLPRMAAAMKQGGPASHVQTLVASTCTVQICVHLYTAQPQHGMYRAATNSSYSQLGSDLSRNVRGEQTRLGSSGSSGPCWASSLRAGGCGSGRPACAAAGPRSRRGQGPGVPPWLRAAGSGPGSAPPWQCATGATGPGPS